MKRPTWLRRTIYGVFAFVMACSLLNGWQATALETSIGDGVMFYGQSGNSTPRTRTYQANANTFGNDTASLNGAVPATATIKTSPTKQEAIAGYVTAAGVLQIMCYNGTSWTNEWSVNVGGSASTNRFDIAYETASGDVLVVYSTGVASTNELAYRTKSAASGCGSANWSGAVAYDVQRTAGVILWVRLEYNPASTSNFIGLAWSDDANDLSAMQWNGTTWSVAESTSALETDLERITNAGDTITFDIAYESLAGNFMVVWGVSDAALACTAGMNCMRYARYTTSWGAATAIPTVADDATTIDASASPSSNEIVIAAIGNRESDLSIAYWSGSAWTGRANVDTTAATPAAGQKLVVVGYLISNNVNSIVSYADGTAPTTSISFYSGATSTFTARTDFASSPTPGAFRWFDIQNDPINQDHLMFSFSDAANDLFAKRLIVDGAGNFVWSNSDGGTTALEANLTQATTSPFSYAYWRYVPPPSAAQGDMQIVYGEGPVVTPRNRAYSSTTASWTAERSLPTGGAAVQTMTIKASPTRNEMVAAVVNTSGLLTVYRWDGTTWTTEWTATVGAAYDIRIAVAYEQLSGDALVIYSTNTGTSNQLAFRTWNGSAWTAATNYTTTRTTGVVHYIVAKPRPGTDEIGVAWGDAARGLSANYWNGSAFTSEPAAAFETDLAQINGAISNIHSPVFDIAFEEQSGRMMLGWGVNTTVNFRYVMRSAGAAGTWGPIVAPAGFNAQATIMRLASRPSSNDIAFICHTNYNAVTATTTQDVQAAAWDGTNWTVNPVINSGISAAEGEFDVGVEWLQSGANAQAVFTVDMANSAAVDYFTYDKTAATFSSVTAFSGTPAPSGTNDRLLQLNRNPFNAAEATLLMVDSLNDIYVKKVVLSGTTLNWSSVDPAGTSMEVNNTSPTQAKGWSADIAYRRYFFTTGTLTADIVDAGGNAVASPSLSFSSVASSSDCQTATGIFGITSQKIRVANTTASSAWSLSMAATGGAAANWTSGTANYDFNDANGSPAGCTDGSDADSLAGQLTVSPGASTITPQGSCTNTGLTAGSSAGFSEGATDSITLLTSSASAQTNCSWDVTGIGLSQKIPSFQAPGSYAINMTLTVVAN